MPTLYFWEEKKNCPKINLLSNVPILQMEVMQNRSKKWVILLPSDQVQQHKTSQQRFVLYPSHGFKKNAKQGHKDRQNFFLTILKLNILP